MTTFVNGQNFKIEKNKTKFSVPINTIDGIVIVPISINGSVPLNFILDTGSPYTIITNVEAIQYFQLKKGKQINVSGLGRDTQNLEAYLSLNNTITIGKATSSEMKIVLLYDQDFNLSGRIGLPVYGIIGYDLLKDFVVEVDYSKNKISFFNSQYFNTKKKYRKFEPIPIYFRNNKPFVKLKSEISGKEVLLDLLVDTGSWDALWLFEKNEENVAVPPIFIDDYLGYGLNGEIHGKKARITSLKMGEYTLAEPTTSFPDSLSISTINNQDRNGTLGSEILRRFTVVYDYSNQQIFIRKNRRFSEPFHYNLAGMELYQPYANLPYLEVVYIRKNSPADLAGLLKGDAIRLVNDKKIGIYSSTNFDQNQSRQSGTTIEFGNKTSETITLPEIIALFKSKVGEKISITFSRGQNEVQRTVTIELKKSI